jgi:N-acetyl-anhydromuramyl-L-alanine amidase AmpD
MLKYHVTNFPEYIILHHSFTKDGNVVDWDAIRRYHIDENGWKDIGYHYGLEKVNGEYVVKIGRPEWEEGGHTKGMNNKSIGICVVGNFDVDELEPEAFEMLKELVLDIMFRYGIPAEKIKGHCDFSDKTCPGKKFPLKKLQEIHWAEPLWAYLKVKGVDVSDKRFDDYITRGEAVALIYKLLNIIRGDL